MGCVSRALVSAILFVLMLLGVTSQHVSFVWLLRVLHQAHVTTETRHLAAFILILVPYLFAGVQLVWNTSFISSSNRAHMPNWKHILLGITISILEGLCVFVFTVEVAANLPEYIFLPLRNAVFGFPILLDLLPWNKETQPSLGSCSQDSRHWSGTPAACNTDSNKLVFSFAALLSPLLLGILLNIEGDITLPQTVSLVLSVWGVSLAWSPKLIIRCLTSSCGLGNTSRRIQSLYLSFKILALLVSLMIYANLYWTSENQSVHILSSLLAIASKDVIVPFSLNLASGLIAHGLSYAALALCLPLVGISIPVAASTPIAVFICAVLSSSVHLKNELHLSGSGPYVYVAATIASLIWLALFLIKCSDFGRSPRVLSTPYDVLFLSHGWNSVFFDQFLLLGYKSDGFGRIPKAQLMTDKSESKVFLCTTMFREASYEMERALESYQRLSYSDQFHNVHLEVHVFMDSGCSGTELQPFARQLLDLIRTTLGGTLGNALCYLTPYGIQFRWTLRGGLPLFVHLKDPELVKSKKRWSQAMYMNYIIYHRTKLLNKRHTWNLVDWDESEVLDAKKLSVSDDEKQIHSVPTSSGTSGFVDEMGNSNTETFSSSASRSGATMDTTNNRFDETHKDVDEELFSRPPTPSSLNIHSNSNICKAPFPHTNSSTTLDMAHQDLEGSESKSIDTDYANSIITESSNNDIKNSTISLDRAFTAIEKVRTNFREAWTMSRHRDKDEEVLNSMPTTSASGCIHSESANDEAANQVFNASGPSGIKGIDNKGFEGETYFYASEKSFPDRTVESAIAVPHDITTLKENNHQIENSTQMAGSRFETHNLRLSFNGSTDIVSSEKVDSCEKGTDISSMSKSNSSNHVLKTTDTVESGTLAFEDPVWLDDQTYILATDADTEFQPDSVVQALNWCNQDRTIGAVCGRIHPIGKRDRLIVWHQIFEYSVDFWNLKTTQHSIGSVLCSPGCFSLYRALALNQILQAYISPTTSPLGVYVKDTGEDRWMTTLMMLEGWQTRYCPVAHNTTFCPDSFDEFLKQRRRWILSDFANTFLVIRHIRQLMRRNEGFTLLFVVYQSIVFTSTMLSVGSTIFVITAGLDMIFGVGYLYTTPLLAVVVIMYAILCTRLESRAQTHLTVALTAVLGCTFCAVVAWGFVFYVKVALQESLTNDQKALQYYVVVFLVANVGFPALCHLPEANRACYGVAYIFTFPLVHCLVHIYSVCNIVDQSWGTRDGKVSMKSRQQGGIWKDMPVKKPESEDTEKSAPEDNTREACGSGVELKEFRPMEAEGDSTEYEWWLRARDTILGNKVNLGMDKKKLTRHLGPIRNKYLFGLLLVNFIWLSLISMFYVGEFVTVFELNIFGLFVAVFYGFCLSVRFVGLVTSRTDVLFKMLVQVLYEKKFPVWITHRKGKKCW